MRRIIALIGSAFVLFGVGSCGSGSEVERVSEPIELDLSQSFSEQDISMIRAALDAARSQWDSKGPGPYTMRVFVGTFSEVKTIVDADGQLESETIVNGTAADVEVLPRTVSEAFDVLDRLISDYEDGRWQVPEPGECGVHLNVRFDPDLGYPSSYDQLGPCDDGVGVEIAVERDLE